MYALPTIPPLGGTPLLFLLAQAGVLLLAAVLLGRLAMRFNFPAIVGELLAGVLLGPSLLGHAAPAAYQWLFPQTGAQFHLLDAVGQIGVVLLVAITGASLDLGLIRRRRGMAVRVSLPGFLIPLGLGVTVGLLLPGSFLVDNADRPAFALFIGVAMSVSAIPVIAKTLMDLRLLHRNIGQLILMAGTVDDLLGWLGLSVVTAVATTGLRAGGLAYPVVALVGVVLGAIVLGRPLVRRVMRVAARQEGSGTVVAATAVLVLLCAAATQALHLEAIFGALIAGILVSSAGPEIVARLAPLRLLVTAVLAPLFFATAGLRMDLSRLADPMVLGVALLLLLIAVVGKFSGAFVGASISGLNRWEAIALGAGMNARGVVEVVVAMVGVQLGILSTTMYTTIVLIAIVTSLMSPPILRFSMSRLGVTADEELRLRSYGEPAPVEVPAIPPA
ncbi:cation:proton antiporter [Micromonospora sp. NBC_01405]|uniref:cation:proton antiporter n=1 Tax=Micromonospora sp. NBC_01405 TaxID=2903589 RepID=UPI0032549D8F